MRLIAPRGTRRRMGPWFIMVAVLLVLLAFPSAGSAIISPIARMFVRLGTSLYTLSFWTREAAMATPEDLEASARTREALAVEKAECERLKAQNAQLRETLGYTERTGNAYVAADVIAKSMAQAFNRFVVNVGSAQGVAVGDPVVAGQGILVGKVVEVTAVSATATAITDADTATAVALLNGHQTVGVAQGMHGGLLSLSYIPLAQGIAVDDLVVTSGLEERVPSGLLVGIVNAVGREEGSLFQSAVVEPLTDVRLLSSVLILTVPRL